MRFSIIILAFLSVSLNTAAQTVNTLIRCSDPFYNQVSIINTPLFNADEIKKRGIQICYITLRKNYPNPEIIDTLFIFHFDQDGNIIKRTSYDRHSGTLRDTLLKGPWDSRHASKHILRLDTLDNKVKETRWSVWQYQGNDFPADTASVITRIYDKEGKLLEEEENATQDYIDVWHCGTGLVPLIKYQYDLQGRVSEIHIDDWNTTATLSYQKRKIHFLIKRKAGVITTTSSIIRFENTREIKEENFYGKIVLTKLATNSGLLKKISSQIFSGGDYEFHYSLK